VEASFVCIYKHTVYMGQTASEVQKAGKQLGYTVPDAEFLSNYLGTKAANKVEGEANRAINKIAPAVDKGVLWSFKMLGKAANNPNVKRPLTYIGKQGEKAIDANESYQRWRVRQAQNVTAFGALTQAGAEVNIQISEAVRGLMPSSVYHNAEQPLRDAEDVIRQLDQGVATPSMMERYSPRSCAVELYDLRPKMGVFFW